jgi:hypothetical protein
MRYSGATAAWGEDEGGGFSGSEALGTGGPAESRRQPCPDVRTSLRNKETAICPGAQTESRRAGNAEPPRDRLAARLQRPIHF